MIEVFKITHNIYDEAVSPDLSFYASSTRGNNYFFCMYFKYSEQSPKFNADASTVNAFKARLDKFWSHQAVKYDFTADLTGTGNR